MPDPQASTLLQIALPVPLPQTFDYRTPNASPADADWRGCRVRVPFANRDLVGVVVGLGDEATLSAEAKQRLRTAIQRLDASPLLAGELLGSLAWAASYYQRPLGEVLNHALPALLRSGADLPPAGTPAWRWQPDPAVDADPACLRAGSRPRHLAERLQRQGVVSEAELAAENPAWRASIRRLQALAWIAPCRIAAEQVERANTPGPALNGEQQQAVDAIRAGAGFHAVLLDGITGSGKTEVYLHAIEDCLARGQQALLLVPEIGLTPQLLQRFSARLPCRIWASHSGMTDRERLAAWAAMFRGEGRVLVGTRSAVFTPLPEAGLIVIDEEHDASFKQQDGFRYHARDLALYRARALAVPIILGSATPSLETLKLAQDGRRLHLRLRQRAASSSTPTVQIVDARQQRLSGGLSAPAFAAISEHLDRGEQVLVFRNRRGYAPVLLCHDCGWSARCKHCDAALTVHAGGGRLICHHCGVRQPAPRACPDCASLGLLPQGAGTERLEASLAERFPEANLIRVDRDNTRGRDALAAHFNRLGDQAGILVGTQMLAKGHDLPGLTLVVVVGIDEGLYSSDFRAGERLAQLLVQVSGRAGRAARPGRVLLQTHHPQHPLLHTLLNQGYHGFAERELAERQAADLPPNSHMALLRAEAKTVDAVNAFLHAARAKLPADNALNIHGPLPAPMPRRQGRWRGQLLLDSSQRGRLHQLLSNWTQSLYTLPEARRVRWSLDVDPVDLF